MRNKQIIFIIILMILGMAAAAYTITYGIYAVIDHKKEEEIKKQEIIRLDAERIEQERLERERQERERLEALRQEQQRLNEEKAQEEKHIKIHFKEPSSLSFKSKEEIYNIRKSAVENSIFKDPNYYPSNEVFGQIESYKPWNSMRQCMYDSTKMSDIDGPSEEARYIDNPEFLVAIEYSFYGYSCEKRKTHELQYSRPDSIEYDKEKNEIQIVYGGFPYCNSGTNAWFNFKGLNARDLGYKYMYIDKEKSTFDLKYVEQVNASNSIVELQDYIHLGGSCGHASGCNNASPNQPPLNFYYPCTNGNSKIEKNQTIYIKLWKNRPNSPEDTPDITEKIIITNVWVNK